MGLILRILDDKAGATAIEYALILATIAVALAGAFGVLGEITTGLFERAIDAFPVP